MDSPLIPFALGMSPRGRVVVDPEPSEDARLDPALARELLRALGEHDAPALLDLAARHPSTPLPNAVGFFRDLARIVLAPPMLGHEYLDAASLRALGNRLTEALGAALAAAGQSLEAWLRDRSGVWAVVGRVCFHLAENRQNAERPFAFLATYAVGLSASAGTQHRPLGVALTESAAAGDREGLLRLLLPVTRAAEAVGWLKALVDTQAIFRPQAWTPAEAPTSRACSGSISGGRRSLRSRRRRRPWRWSRCKPPRSACSGWTVAR